ncbi:MAG: HEAT repeat domain-containing protein [Asgard group archaeon]|nr:HEAT repeat domain-containing protein [Asgard group archaeon]
MSQLTNKNWLERKKAANLSKKLNKRGDILEIIPEMISALENDENERVRAEIAQSLSKFGELAENAIPSLINSMTHDESKEVRKWSVIALGEIGPKAEPAVSALIEMMQHEESQILRKNALLALGKIGNENKKVLPALKKFQQDNNDWWVKSIVNSIIQKISA